MFKKRKALLVFIFLFIILISAALISGCSLKNTGKKADISSSNNLKVIPETIPYKGEIISEKFPSKVTESEGYIDYIVNKGDTVSSICRKYQTFCPEGTAVKTVLAINQLTDGDALKEGMILKLPDSYFTSGIKYTIEKGDTLFCIARKHLPSSNVNEAIAIIMKDNFMSSKEINSGDELFIENGK